LDPGHGHLGANQGHTPSTSDHDCLPVFNSSIDRPLRFDPNPSNPPLNRDARYAYSNENIVSPSQASYVEPPSSACWRSTSSPFDPLNFPVVRADLIDQNSYSAFNHRDTYGSPHTTVDLGWYSDLGTEGDFRTFCPFEPLRISQVPPRDPPQCFDTTSFDCESSFGTNLVAASSDRAIHLPELLDGGGHAAAGFGFVYQFSDSDVASMSNNHPNENGVQVMANSYVPAEISNHGCLSTKASASNPTTLPVDADFYSQSVKDKATGNQSFGPSPCNTSAGSKGPNDPIAGSARAKCTHCQKTFSRKADLQRHAQKHQSGEPPYQCGVKGCDYGGSHRLDKMGSHIKNRHLKANEYRGILTTYSKRSYWARSLTYCFPASGDCLFSQDFLGSKIYQERRPFWQRFGNPIDRYFFPATEVLTEDLKGLKRTEALLNKAQSQN